MSLLHAAYKLVKPGQLYCLHYDHALRPDSAIADLELSRLCKELGIHYYSERNPNSPDSDEDSLRKLRYQFYINAASSLALNDILLAHNLNDNSETILFRLFRGTSTSGVTGIPSSRELTSDISIHRPWLQLSRDAIENYASELGIKAIEDSSNQNTNYARNFIRINILPQASKINPKAIENLSNFASLIAEQNQFIEAELSKYTKDFTNQDPELNWDLEAFRRLAPVIQRKLLELHFSTSISFCNDFLEAIAKGGFNRINFENGKYFCIRQKRIRLEQD